jgi:hypothetical protein
MKAGEVEYEELFLFLCLASNLLQVYRTWLMRFIFVEMKFGHLHKGKNINLRVFENRLLKIIFGRDKVGVIEVNIG